ncbi:hypothetical protein [Novilysobacter spongiicola]|uniref:hypothetical protein n=1 Tax=Novilysobacter spongiicola TaxID=435289 RepID=UPI001356310C|nr:hypothetical protein [Lysobacter spongiicola]
MDDADLADNPDACDQELDEPISIMLSMKDRKVYVGWVQWVAPLRVDESPYIKIVPAWSGYRDPSTLRVEVTDRYDSRLFKDPVIPRGKVIAIGDIANASLYDRDAFELFSSSANPLDQSTPSNLAPTSLNPITRFLRTFFGSK